ncbi:hypothetical protein L6307_03825 [Candidatus Parcubacteria bacterium]|nr:hypothetical protein [Candidatus Parcubacteria bacterium]
MKIENCKMLILQKIKETNDYLKTVLVSCGAKAENIYTTNSVEVAKIFIFGEALRQGAVNFVITGIGSQEEIGPVLLNWIKSEGIKEEMPVVYFHSGGDETWVMEKVKEHGADGFLPSNVYLLKEKIINAIKDI